MTHPATLFVGIDDTDNLESKGTGYHARTLGALITEHALGTCVAITRHQLLVSPLVPYTSHNSAACLVIEGGQPNRLAIQALCRDYLLEHSAPGSDAGLCVADASQLSLASVGFGMLCKHQLVGRNDAAHMAADLGVFLAGLTGTHDGMVGAFAAVNLCASGVDGRVLWIKGIRELANQAVRLGELKAHTGLNVVQSMLGQVMSDPMTTIHMGPWPRAVWLGGQSTLIVEPNEENSNEWKVVGKDELKRRF